MWKDDNVISFEASVKERGVTVVKNGMTILLTSRRATGQFRESRPFCSIYPILDGLCGLCAASAGYPALYVIMEVPNLRR